MTDRAELTGETPRLDFHERQHAQAVYEECCENPEDFAYQFVALESELAEAQKDAERYQWLRANMNAPQMHRYMNAREVDAAIDAAIRDAIRAQEPSEGGGKE